MKVNASQTLFAIALIGAIALFALGKSTEAEFLVMFMAGQLLPQPQKPPLNPTPGSERAGIDP